MKFGKLPDISDIDFRLPPDPSGNRSRLPALPSSPEPPQLYIGCTGWSMKEWVGRVYPKGTKAKDYLKAYSLQFNTIELNTTHYRIPSAQAVEKWYRESTSDFRFCPKVPQSISHSKALGLGTDLIPAFCQAIAGLREKLGCCFLQLPPYFGAERLPQLVQFLEAFPAEQQLAVEVRHESWFESPQSLEQLLDTLHRLQRSIVITDVAGRRDVLHMGVTNTTALVRFVGNGLHPTDYERAADWVERLKQWAQQGVHEIYFFPHEPDNLLAPEMAAHFHEAAASGITGIQTRGPELSEPGGAKGAQMSLF
ncbi:MAG: DUF72 domain-containing protein [Phaeodactylibacter sp.]|uniref:DUF72 domain-containing protein n=1 Tax=Phaeodactylibacter sp. TaxID=1940289 RepID=UPI0032ED837E